MKRLITFILVILMIFSLIACEDANNDAPFDKDTSVVETSKDAGNTDTDSVESDTPATKEPTDTSEPNENYAFNYKMALIGDIDVNGQRHVSYVIEVTDGNWDWGGSSSDFDVLDSATNKPIDYNVSGVSFFPGRVCKNKDGYHEASSNFAKNDLPLMTIIISNPPDDFDVNGANIQVTMGYYKNVETVLINPEYSTFVCSINSDISEITTRQPYIHGYTLVQLGDGYYVIDCSKNLHGAGDLYGTNHKYAYNAVYLRCLSGDPNDDLSELLSNAKPVDAQGSTLNLGELDFYIDYNPSKLEFKFGIQYDNNHELTNEEGALHVYPLLVFEDGYESFFKIG